MGLLSALNLPPSRSMGGTPPKAPPLPKGQQSTKKTLAHAEPAEPEAPRAATPAGDSVAAEVPVAPPTTQSGSEAAKGKADGPAVVVEGGFGDWGGGVKASDDGTTFTVKHEKKHTAGRVPFKVGALPMFLKLDLKASAEGEVTFGPKKNSGSFAFKAGGVVTLGAGVTSEEMTATVLHGVVDLSATLVVKPVLGPGGMPRVEPVTLDVIGTGKFGTLVEFKDKEAISWEVEVDKWELYKVDLGEMVKGSWTSMKVREGKDMQRLTAGIRSAGPKIQDAVELLAPPVVKIIAEVGAKWVAESDLANKLAEKTDQILQDYKKENGIDLRDGIQSLVRDLCDPGGETSAEATERVKQEAEAFIASHESFNAAMLASGLKGGELRSRTAADAAEYNAIVDVWAAESEVVAKGGSASDKWRPMIEQLVAKRRAAKAERERQVALVKKGEDEAAKAELARRLNDAEIGLQAAWTAANHYGNPLNNSPLTTPGSQRRKAWQDGMRDYFNKGVQLKQALGSFQGEERITRTNQAADLFRKAAQAFQAGGRLTV